MRLLSPWRCPDDLSPSAASSGAQYLQSRRGRRRPGQGAEDRHTVNLPREGDADAVEADIRGVREGSPGRRPRATSSSPPLTGMRRSSPSATPARRLPPRRRPHPTAWMPREARPGGTGTAADALAIEAGAASGPASCRPGGWREPCLFIDRARHSSRAPSPSVCSRRITTCQVSGPRNYTRLYPQYEMPPRVRLPHPVRLLPWLPVATADWP